MPKDTIISSRNLVTYHEIDYWSRIYDAGDHILKQASLDLASREAYFLNKFDNKYFPHVYESASTASWSTIKLEKIEGIPLAKAIDDITDSAENFYMFIRHCLKILDYLKREGITHRDIRIDNIIFRDNTPVLIDFGWAVCEGNQYFAPDSLGEKERPPDGVFCDVYSIGKVLSAVNRHKYTEFDNIIDFMIEADTSLRIADLKILGILFSVTADKYFK
jgi:serine/threonine protein kinase